MCGAEEPRNNQRMVQTTPEGLRDEHTNTQKPYTVKQLAVTETVKVLQVKWYSKTVYLFDKYGKSLFMFFC